MKEQTMGMPPKHDYDSEDFYKKLEDYARRGYTDRNIANALDLAPEVFSRMKNGKYQGWSDELNKERSVRYCQALARGRDAVNLIVRDTYLKTALGGKKIKTVVNRHVEKRCPCNGSDEDCELCGGIGTILMADKSIVSETEIELAPNVQALSVWLFNHDEEWKKAVIEGKRLDVTSGGKEIAERPINFISASELTKEQLDDYLKQDQKDNETNVD